MFRRYKARKDQYNRLKRRNQMRRVFAEEEEKW
jgi:hypothetical protein